MSNDPFADIRDKRMGELNEEQTERAAELWLRTQIGPSESYWHPLLKQVFRVIDRLRAPIDMVLHCPKCGMQHIDKPESPKHTNAINSLAGLPARGLWTNPPHRSHLCHGCGHIWRPADVPTNGVAAIKTKGKDGMGHEVFAKSVDDVVNKLSEMGERLADLEDSPTAQAEAAQPVADWLHLKPYGYAPGNYMSKCHRCGSTPIMDKRAVTCRPCAEAMAAAPQPTEAALPAPSADAEDRARNAGFVDAARTFGPQIERMQDCLRSIREHCAVQPSALAAAIVATCDNGLRDASKQPAPASSVKIPTTEAEAELMQKLGYQWLQQHAPHRLVTQQPELWRPMNSAPTDGTLVNLLIEGGEHALEDESMHRSVGSFVVEGGAEEDPTWNFAGWCWHQDCYCRGTGTPVGWLPLPAITSPATFQGEDSTKGRA